MNGNQQNGLFTDGNIQEFVHQPQPGIYQDPAPVVASAGQGMTDFEGGISESLDDIRQFLDEIKFGEEINSDLASPQPDNVTNDPNSPYHGQWDIIQQLLETGSETVKAEIDRIWLEMDDPLFNISFRNNFASIIEHMRWDLINSHDTQPGSSNMRRANAMVGELHVEVGKRLAQISQGGRNQDFRYQLKRWYDKLADPYIYPMVLVQLMQNVLIRERFIIEQSQAQTNVGSSSRSTPEMRNRKVESIDQLSQISVLSSELIKLEKLCQHTAGVVENLHSRVQELQVPLQGKLSYVDHFNTRDFSPNELMGFNNILGKRNSVVQEEKNLLEQCYWAHHINLENVLNQVTDREVKEYLRDQAYLHNGKIQSHRCNIHQLQDWWKRLAKLVSGNLQQMGKLQFLEEQLGLDKQSHQPNMTTSWQYITELTRRYSGMLEQLVEKGLIVEDHPPQVLMKDKRFQCKLRHLVCDSLDIHQVPFEVEVFLINADHARMILQEGPNTPFKESGTIVNSKVRSDYLTHNGILSVTMRNMCLKMQQRGPQRAAEMVAELKFAMLFRASIMVRHSPQQTPIVTAWTMSLPIVVISHGKQEADAQATIFWDNAFAKIARAPFEVEDTVPWSDMLEALDGRWKKECGSVGTGLSNQSKQYLTTKVFRERETHDDLTITWRRFNQDKQLGFTFWTWFFKAMELCSNEHVKKYWNRGLIHGFLSKADCQDMLLTAAQGRQAGIFLFRFSETKLGAISISCTTDANNTIQVCNLEPDEIKNFRVRSLPNMVRDLDYLHYLYPNTPKHEAFGEFYSVPAVSQPTDYLKKEFKVAIVDPKINHRSSVSDQHPDSPCSTSSFQIGSPGREFAPDSDAFRGNDSMES